MKIVFVVLIFAGLAIYIGLSVRDIIKDFKKKKLDKEAKKDNLDTDEKKS